MDKPQIRLTNTLTGAKEAFQPVKKGFLRALGLGKPHVGMYHCGPTVYHYAHIGNLRAYVFADTLKRLMKESGFKVDQVINITDVGHLVSDGDTGEDKMEKAKRREGKTAWDVAKLYTDAFFKDLEDLNVDTGGTKFPRATDFIKEQIGVVKKLEAKGLTYRTSDGIYFDTAKFPGYGRLGKINLSGIREGERIGVNAEKRNSTDFALWKFSPATSTGERRDMEWNSPWGVGFPGWHIECSAMAMSLLGETIDIHTGGIDHIPVHHNNEIAQSEGVTGHDFARFWMHVAFVTVQDGGKMAKSEGNFLTLSSLKEKGYSPMDYRYLLLGARYSTPVAFSFEALDAAKNARTRLNKAVCELPWGGKASEAYWQKALSFAGDDLDTPKVLALQWEILKDAALSPEDKKATILKVDSLLGLAKEEPADAAKDQAVPADVQRLVDERAAARAAKDWKRSDELRDQIAAAGWTVKDTQDGQKVSKA